MISLVYNSVLLLALDGNSINGSFSHSIHYLPEGNDTKVIFDEEELLCPNDAMSVFQADLKMIMKNQKTVLVYFSVIFDCEISSKINQRNASLWKCIEQALKARSSPLPVKGISVINSDITSAWSMVRRSNPVELIAVLFDWLNETQTMHVLTGDRVNFEDHLNGLRGLEKGYRFDLMICVTTLQAECLMAINEFPSLSESLHNLEIIFADLQHQDDCDTVLSDKLFVAKRNELWTIQFVAKNPRAQEPPANTVEEIGRSVLENPLLMQSILHQLECFDIQRLRKVNRGVRKCIDEMKPDPHIEKFSITFDILTAVNLPETRVKLESGDFKTISYKTKKGISSTTFCLNDFEATLKHQKSCMEELLIIFKFTHFERLDSCVGLCKEIGDILKRREHPLKTQKLSMAYGSQQDIMEILPAMDTAYLKIIEFSDPSDQECMAFFGIEELPFEVDQLSQTDQWKNAEHLIVKDLTIPTSIQDINILHFSSLEILL
ncbi:unnamed protein product [Caenorhabditis nigoni]